MIVLGFEIVAIKKSQIALGLPEHVSRQDVLRHPPSGSSSRYRSLWNILYLDMSKKMQIKINPSDLKMIYGDDYEFFTNKVLTNCRCINCDTPFTSTIVNYKVFISHLNDIVLKGHCAKVQLPHEPVSRNRGS